MTYTINTFCQKTSKNESSLDRMNEFWVQGDLNLGGAS